MFVEPNFAVGSSVVSVHVDFDNDALDAVPGKMSKKEQNVGGRVSRNVRLVNLGA